MRQFTHSAGAKQNESLSQENKVKYEKLKDYIHS